MPETCLDLDKLRDELTYNQRIFCDEYLIDRNGTRAYRVAYPSVKKDKTAKAAASRLLTNVNVKAYIEARMAHIAEKNEITVSRVLEEESRLAFSDIRDIFNGETLMSPSELPESVARAISGIERTERYTQDEERIVTYKYKFWDKGRALQRIERHLGMDGQGDEGIEKGLRELGDRLERAIKRSAKKD